MAWECAIGQYRATLDAGARSPGTVRLQCHYLRHFARTVPAPRDATEATVVAWLATPGWSPETRKSARSTVCGFYRWAEHARVVEHNPTKYLPSIRVPSTEARPCPQVVVDGALERATGSQRLMVLLARYAALRCCEIARVHSSDLVGDLLYVTGKGGKRRIVPVIHPELLAALTTADGYLFPGAIDGHVSPAWVSKQVGRLLDGDWTAHKLRHAFASTSYAHNPDIYALAKVMGHSRVETTQRYTRMPADNLRRVAEAAA